MKIRLWAALVASLSADLAIGQSCCELARPEARPPILTMSGHVHRRGELMAGYMAHVMQMRHPHSMSAGHVHTGSSLMAMTMQMHMAHLMYGLTDRLTAMAMGVFVQNSMPGSAAMRSAGFGDLRAGAVWGLAKGDHWSLQAQAIASFPTGSISERASGESARLPYMMQLGSGTFDALPGAAFFWQKGRWATGWQAQATLRTGLNRYGYRLGNAVSMQVWAARRLSARSSLSVRGFVQRQGRIEGHDPEIANTDLIPAGLRMHVSLGANFLLGPTGCANRHRAAIEGAGPVFYSENLARLRTDFETAAGYEFSHRF